MNKTLAVVMLDGKRWDTVERYRGHYWIAHPQGGEVGYSHMDALKEAVSSWGGKIVRVPNPNYREPNPLAFFFPMPKGR